MKKLRMAVIGCGARAQVYARLFAEQPEKYELVAGADPVTARTKAMQEIAGNPDFHCFPSAESLFAHQKLADLAIIASRDIDHKDHAIGALKKGYHLLLEKPIAPILGDIKAVEKVANERNRKIIVCHELRYTPFYRKVKELVDSGILGRIVSLHAVEGVDAWHQSHSFVRGHWSKNEDCPMLLSKCSHDLDLISWLMNSQCRSISSFGHRSYFTQENMPQGATRRCTDGCPHVESCPYSSLLYTTTNKSWLEMIYDKARTADDETIRKWLASSPWGRCVYQCDNTTVDHQVVNMQFENNATASLTMTAFDISRQIEIYGSKAILKGGGSFSSTMSVTTLP